MHIALQTKSVDSCGLCDTFDCFLWLTGSVFLPDLRIARDAPSPAALFWSAGALASMLRFEILQWQFLTYRVYISRTSSVWSAIQTGRVGKVWTGFGAVEGDGGGGGRFGSEVNRAFNLG